jgi:hypothetical protein
MYHKERIKKVCSHKLAQLKVNLATMANKTYREHPLIKLKPLIIITEIHKCFQTDKYLLIRCRKIFI